MTHQLWNGRTTPPNELVGEEPDGPEDTDPRADVEKRIDWICDEWADANRNDDYETWSDIRMMIYGAKQTLVYCVGTTDDQLALAFLGDMALFNGTECIIAGKYEGAK